MRVLIITFLFFINSNLFCQVKVEFSTLSFHDLFRNIFYSETLALEEYYEKTGVLKEEFFYGESYKLDSLKRFYENGNIAYSGIILDKINVFSEFTFSNIAYALKTYEITFYENGCKRSISFEDNTNEKLSHFFCLFDEKSNEIVYRKEIYQGQTISGVVWRNIKENQYHFEIYKNGRIDEKWYVSDFNFSDSTNTFMLDRIELNDSTVISKSRKLKRHIRKKNILYWKPGFLIW